MNLNQYLFICNPPRLYYYNKISLFRFLNILQYYVAYTKINEFRSIKLQQRIEIIYNNINEGIQEGNKLVNW